MHVQYEISSRVECTGTTDDTNPESVVIWNLENLFIVQTNLGARTVLLWNFALDENNGPRGVSGGCSNCVGVVEVKSDGTYSKNTEYYAIGKA